jgi:hypothetical protein
MYTKIQRNACQESEEVDFILSADLLLVSYWTREEGIPIGDDIVSATLHLKQALKNVKRNFI